MKTPMQEAIEKVQSLRQISPVINPIGVTEETPTYVERVESILSEMLEKEEDLNARIAELEWEVSGLKQEIKYL